MSALEEAISAKGDDVCEEGNVAHHPSSIAATT